MESGTADPSPPFAPCFSCKILTLQEDLISDVLDFDVLLQYFKFETEFHRFRRYCPGCHASLVKIREKHNALVQSRVELESSVLRFKMRRCPQVRASESPALSDASTMPIPSWDAGVGAPCSPPAPPCLEERDVNANPEALVADYIECNGSFQISSEETSNWSVQRSWSVLNKDHDNNSTGCLGVSVDNTNTATDIEVGDVKLFMQPDSDCESENEEDKDQNQSSRSSVSFFGTEQSDSARRCAYTPIPVFCPYCEITFESITKFDKHFLRLHPGKKLQCEHCDKTCSNSSKLREHCVAVHENGCNQREEKEKQNPTNLPFPCRQCGKVFYTNSERLSHISQAHRRNLPKLETLPLGHCHYCQKCPLSFNSKASLFLHKKRVHGLHSQKFYCLKCGMTFVKKTIFESHRHNEDGSVYYKCLHCHHQSFNWCTIHQHMLRVHAAEMSTQHQESYWQPYRSKYGKKPSFTQSSRSGFYKCSECSFYAKNQQSLVYHKLRFHGRKSEGQYCGECGRRFHKRVIFDHHVHTVSGIRYRCPKDPNCPITATTWANALAHATTHPPFDDRDNNNSVFANEDFKSTENQPCQFQVNKKCSHCGEEFATVSAKAIHEREVHSGPGNSAFKCQICDESFQYRYSLEKHMEICDLFERIERPKQ